MDSVSAHQKGMPMASHHRNQQAERCIVGLADSARFADSRLADACFAVVLAGAVAVVALAVAAGSAALPVVAGPIRCSALFLDS